jgi:uncharacterized membrane protein YhaH (DUF805 family)
MNEFKLALENYAVFSGRTSRREYWMFVLFNILFTLIANALDFITGFNAFAIVYNLILFVPSIAIVVRRLHDINRSGWYYLISLIPLVGWVIIIYWLCQKGDAGMNAYGRGMVEINTNDFYDPTTPADLEDPKESPGFKEPVNELI